MILTEIIKYSKQELEFIKFWNSCEWVYWEECPKSIFLVKDMFCVSNGVFIKEKYFNFELDWKGKKIKYHRFCSFLERYCEGKLGIDLINYELDDFIIKLHGDLLNETNLSPEKIKLINKIESISSHNKNKVKKDTFTPFAFEGFNNRINKFEKFLKEEYAGENL
jgi:hypothetical protein